ncbi:MAG: family 43 glycosylhydrolase [Hyphomicrobiaceae bacterium]
MLNGDCPDVDIELRRDTDYLIASTNHYAPRMTIAESKNRLNWMLIGHVYEQLDWHPAYGSDKMGENLKGVWAGNLVYHDGR